MKRNSIAVLAIVVVLAITGCSKKDGGNAKAESSASGEGVAVLAQAGGGSSGKASPVSDFSYDLTADGTGIIIKGYTGKGGKVVIPATIENYPVKEIMGKDPYSGGAFEGAEANKTPNNRDSITSIVVPDSVEVIGEFAFSNIDELTQVTLPNGLKTLPVGAFGNCGKLTKVNLPSSLEQIGCFTFSGCSELTELIIPSSLTKINFLLAPKNLVNYDGNGSFYSCQKLPLATRQRLKDLGYKDEF